MLLAAGPDFEGIQKNAGINLPANDIGGMIGVILPYVFGAAALLLLIYLVTAGLGMMLSRGDPKAMQVAQGRITNALIGFVIVFFAYILVSVIGKVFGITVFGNIFT